MAAALVRARRGELPLLQEERRGQADHQRRDHVGERVSGQDGRGARLLLAYTTSEGGSRYL